MFKRTKAYWESKILEIERIKLKHEKLGERTIAIFEEILFGDLKKLVNKIFNLFREHGNVAYSQKPSVDLLNLIPRSFWNGLNTIEKFINTFITHNVKVFIDKVTDSMTRTLSKVFQDSYNRFWYTLEKGTGLKLDLPLIGNKDIKKALSVKYFGRNYVKRLQLYGVTYVQKLKKIIKDGLDSMVDLKVIKNKMDAYFESIHSKNKMLIRTETTHFENYAFKEIYVLVGMERYVFSAILDHRTSDICRSLDGQVFLVEDAEEGVNYPPMLPNCRSSTFPFIPHTEYQLRRVVKDSKGNPVDVDTGEIYSTWYDRTINKFDI